MSALRWPANAEIIIIIMSICVLTHLLYVCNFGGITVFVAAAPVLPRRWALGALMHTMHNSIQLNSIPTKSVSCVVLRKNKYSPQSWLESYLLATAAAAGAGALQRWVHLGRLSMLAIAGKYMCDAQVYVCMYARFYASMPHTYTPMFTETPSGRLYSAFAFATAVFN